MRIGLVATSATLLFLACDDDARVRPAPQVEGTEARRPSYRVIEFNDGGSISGQVRWTGPRPETPSFPVHLHEEVCGATQPSRALTLHGDRVTNAVVALTRATEGPALEPPAEPVELAQRACRFEPHVLAVGVGWPLVFTNHDPIMHNVRVRRGAETVLDIGLPERGARAEASLDTPGVYRVVCDVGHTWQHAWIHVHEHPYFAVSDEHGHFRIRDVAPGRYHIRVWHEGWRVVGSDSGRPRFSSPVVLTRSVSVLSREETTVDFELSQQSAELAGEGP